MIYSVLCVLDFCDMQVSLLVMCCLDLEVVTSSVYLYRESTTNRQTQLSLLCRKSQITV